MGAEIVFMPDEVWKAKFENADQRLKSALDDLHHAKEDARQQKQKAAEAEARARRLEIELQISELQNKLIENDLQEALAQLEEARA